MLYDTETLQLQNYRNYYFDLKAFQTSSLPEPSWSLLYDFISTYHTSLTARSLGSLAERITNDEEVQSVYSHFWSVSSSMVERTGRKLWCPLEHFFNKEEKLCLNPSNSFRTESSGHSYMASASWSALEMIAVSSGVLAGFGVAIVVVWKLRRQPLRQAYDNDEDNEALIEMDSVGELQ